MHIATFARKRRSPRAFEPKTSNPLHSIKPLISHLPTFNRKLLFDKLDSNENVHDNETPHGTLFSKLCSKDDFMCEEDIQKQSDQETEESNSYLRSIPSDGKSSCCKDPIEIESLGQGIFFNTPEALDQSDFSRSPSPKKKHNKEWSYTKSNFNANLQTPLKVKEGFGREEKRPYTDYVNVKAKKRCEEVSRLHNDYEIIKVKNLNFNFCSYLN